MTFLPAFKLCCLWLAVVAFVADVDSAGIEQQSLVLTADTEGHLAGCNSCPGAAGLGGLDKRATAIQRLRDEQGEILLLDAGNALFGADSAASEGRVIAEAYAAIGYDAVNLSYRDFRLGLEHTQTLLADAKLTGLSANLLDDAGNPVFSPMLISKIGGANVAVIGVTEKPAGMEYLPHLKTQLEGLTIADPIETLKTRITEAKQQADKVVVLLYGSPQTVRQVREAVGGEIDALLVGGTRPAELGQLEDAPVTAAASKHGQHLAQVSLGDGSPQMLAITPDTQADAAIAGIIEKHAPPDPWATEADDAAAEPKDLPEDLSDVGDAPADIDSASGEFGAGNGLRLHVEQARLDDEWNGEPAGEGNRWLILRTRIENDIPLDMAFGGEPEAREAVLVAFKQNLFLVGGEKGAAVYPAAVVGRGSETILPSSFTLQRLDSVATGEMAFSVPETLDGPLQVRLYHDKFDPVSVNLRGELPDDGHLETAQGNEYAALAQPGVRFPEEVAGQAAPPGAKWVEVELRGRSTFVLGEEAEKKSSGGLGGALGGSLDKASDESEDDGAEAGRPKPAVYLEAPTHLQLVADGQWARTREQGLTPMPREPTFLPDRFTGGTAVFLAPADAKSLELVCYFPQLQGVNPPMKPQALRFTLQGEAVDVEGEEAMAVVNDDPLPLAVIAAEVTQRSGELKAAKNRSLLVLDCRIRNTSEEDGLYRALGRFNVGGGEAVAVTGRSGAPMSETMLLPAGERRAFKIVLEVPAAFAGGQEVGYSGVSTNAAIGLEIEEAPAEAMAESDLQQPDMEPGEVDLTPPTPGNDATPLAPSDRSWTQPGSLALIGNLVGELPLKPGQPLPLEVSGRNAALQLAVVSATLVDGEYKGLEPGEGEQLLVLGTRWENVQPPPEPKRSDKPPLAPEYNTTLRDRVFLVCNGRRIAEGMTSKDVTLPNGLSVPADDDVRDWQAKVKEDPETAGPAPTVREGELVYRVPAGQLREASLHLLDSTFGNIELPLLGGTDAIEWPQVLPAQNNRIVQLGVWGYDVQEQFLDRDPDRGSVWVVVDLRGRSLRHSHPAESENGNEIPLDHVPQQWDDGYCHLLLDGRYPVMPASHEFQKPLRFLPGATVGGLIGFPIPVEQFEAASRIDLVFDYHPTPLPGEALLRPATASFTLKDGSIDTAPAAPMVVIEDVGVTVAVTGMRRTAELNRAAPEGSEYLVLDVDVTSTMPTGEWFDAAGRLQIVQEGDAEAQSHDARATAATDRPAPRNNRPWWIPSGATRSMQLAWQVDADSPPPSLRYTGLLHDGAWSLENGQKQPPAMPLIGDAPVIDPARRPRGIESAALKPEQVNLAIEKGRLWLWQELQKDLERQELGDDRYHLPMLLALVHTRAHEEFPEFDSLLREYLASVHPTTVGGNATYKNGLLAMLIEGYGDPNFLPKLREVARYLVEDQGPQGAWNYNSATPLYHYLAPPAPGGEESAQDQPECQPEGSLRILGGEPPRDEGNWKMPGEEAFPPMRRQQAWEINGDGDNSVSQFAVLGLWSCARAGIEIEPEVWRRMLRIALDRQARNSGWDYHSGNNSYGSMTCAGLGMVAIAARQLNPEVDLTADPRIREGLKWLADHWETGKNFEKGDEWAYYGTYGIERVGRILGTEFIGPQEWYPPLAKWLVERQGETGAWPAGGDSHERLSSTFALLFLVRATATLEEEAEDAFNPLAREKATTGTLTVEAEAAESGPLIIILDASGSMLAELGGRQKFEVAREAVISLVEGLPEGVPVGLIAYGHRLRATDDGADEDVEVLIPPGPLEKASFRDVLMRLSPRGKTPLALSLDAAAKVLSGGGEATVVLLTDGGQGREPGDPTAAAAAVGRKASLEIIGFDIERTRQAQVWGDQLRAMAEASGGRYLPADDAETLEPSLKSAVTQSPGGFTLHDEQGEQVAEGEFGTSQALPPGRYLFRTAFQGRDIEQELWIKAGQSTIVRFNADHLDQSP